jgi:hypothetical protein
MAVRTLILLVLGSTAQPPSFRGEIDSLLRRPDTFWITYTVPQPPGVSAGHCDQSDSSGPIAYLEGAPEARILLRVTGGRIHRIRTVPGNCNVDYGGYPAVTPLSVDPAQSAAYLETYLEHPYLRASALAALARHTAAIPILLRLAAPNQPFATRKEAIRHLSRMRDPRAQALVDNILNR